MQAHPDIESIFAEAVALTDPDARQSYLDEACADNGELRHRVGRLVRASERAERFMSTPATVFKLPSGGIDAGLSEVGEQVGDVVGPYELTERLGEGGMGCVFLALQQQPVRREVALKIIKPGMDSREVLARFEAERQALALMDHPFIARALDAGATSEGRPYFVMERVHGASITDYCQQHNLTLNDRLRVFQSVCEAIQHAHHKGVVHRDIKPSNILVQVVDGQPIPKVIDFGIAKAVDQRLTEQTLQTRYGELVGTPAYMSPEQAQADGDVDTRSDVYSLGALLYELVTGAAPFDEEELKRLNYDQLRDWICTETPQLPSSRIDTVVAGDTPFARSPAWRSALAGELNWIVMRAMEKERDRRYDTASALAAEIERFLCREPILARPPSFGYRARKWIRRHRVAATCGITVAMSLLVSAVLCSYWAWQSTRAHAQANQAREQLAVEAESLEEVVAFLHRDLLQFSSPRQEPQRDIALRTVLDRAANRLKGRRFSQPEVEQTIRRTLGETYHALGEYQQALVHLRRAEQLARETAAPADTVVAITNRKLAAQLALHEMSRVGAPLAANLQAARDLGVDHPLWMEARNLQAWYLEMRGELEQAEAALTEVLAWSERTYTHDALETLRARANLASVYQSQRRFDQSLELLEGVREKLAQQTGQFEPMTIEVGARLASLRLARGETDLAAQLYEESLAQAEAWLGPLHGQTLTLRHGLAITRARSGRPSEAIGLLEDVLAAQQVRLGPEHPQTLDTMHNLALLWQGQGQADKAEALLQRELAGRQRSSEAGGAAVLDATSSLAFLYMEQTRYADAVTLYRQAYSQLADSFDERAAMAGTMLGLCEFKAGDLVAAEATLEHVMSHMQERLPGHWLTHVIDSLAGEILLTSGDRARALPRLLSGHQGLRQNAASLPENWRPLGLRAALRRLVAFYESAPTPAEQGQAEPYRQELQAVLDGVEAFGTRD